MPVFTFSCQPFCLAVCLSACQAYCPAACRLPAWLARLTACLPHYAQRHGQPARLAGIRKKACFSAWMELRLLMEACIFKGVFVVHRHVCIYAGSLVLVRLPVHAHACKPVCTHAHAHARVEARIRMLSCMRSCTRVQPRARVRAS